MSDIQEDINFDESDKNLFQVDDARLRADALKHSILPRLHIVINDCIKTIKDVYNIEVLDDSLVSKYPNFREVRENDLNLLYEAAYVGLGGKRIKDKWFGVEKKNGKPVQILPFRFGIQLTEEGLGLLFENYWLKGLTDESYRKFLEFHLKYEGLTHSLCYLCELSPTLYHDEKTKPISTFSEHYQFMVENRLFDNNFISCNWLRFPVSTDIIDSIIIRYVLFYPVYDSYINISKGLPIRFLELIEKANAWLEKIDAESDHQANNRYTSPEINTQAKQAAEQRIRVMPAIRWQVFKRDNWKCVSCGRGTQDDIILHVDHIVPRSKGGRDVLENYQTLCSICNIGKSNRDDTDLRKHIH